MDSNGKVVSMTKEINGVTFEVINSVYYKNRNEFKCGNRTLSSVYDHPSQAKQNVWYRWYLWGWNNNILHNRDGLCKVHEFGVYRGNSWNFTIRGLYTDEDGSEYGIMITSSHNRLYKLGTN